MIYCYPDLGGRDFIFARMAGPGLGNMLFPWARAVLSTKRNGFKLIEPTWPQLKLGPLLRRERDARHYGDLFESSYGSVQGMARIKVLLKHRRVVEADLERAKDGDVVMFSGMTGYFEPILHDYEIVRDELYRISREQQRAGLLSNHSDSICVHVRCGDFSIGASKELIAAGRTNVRIPIDWYCDVVTGLREVLGSSTRIQVFSDGSDEELAPLLSLRDCTRVSFGSALADLLALSKGKFLVASGSTFSMWASYLGRMPVFWYPGQRRQRLYSAEYMEPEVGTLSDSVKAVNLALKMSASAE
jgi:hypothetical protein